MLAYIYHSEKKMGLEEISKPVLGDGGALIQVVASSICGTDLRTYRHGSKKINEGTVLGHEFVGKILEISSDDSTNDFSVGDYIGVAPAIGCGECYCCKRGQFNMCNHLKTIGFQYHGAFAEQMVLPKSAFNMGNVYRLPDVEDYSIFTLSEPLACVINAQSYLNIQQGDDVVIFGSGIIGCMHAELAIESGAKQVFMIERSAERIDECQQLLEKVLFINSTEVDIFKEISDKTDGKGADVAIIACSAGGAQVDGMNLLAKGGRISLFGGLPGESNGFIDSNLVHYKEISVYGAHASTPQQNKEAMAMVYSKRIDVKKYTKSQYPLQEIGKAFRDVDNGKIIKATILNT
ncbi:alcohol dehydrogenase catalytic domain-containing protein [Evansella tamaricis]|uniref:Alcohol dehydrogenase catalytic domain-containing protein n=1 Tax=Evansella tamaricis TaxID=2069301 RepID=A0ABS6JBL0_9BACI|nr:alcohol dehydrogenase catalytic domain-containing protein [Evansella tamaricis]MBU9710574.1 alcohol dehydrogenase catalytic domain-containing protein [Evansella tamaricis]